MPRLRRRTVAACTLVSLGGCAMRPSSLPAAEHLVAIKSVRLPVRSWLPWYTRFAEHAFVDVKDGAGWHRIEWNDSSRIPRVIQTTDDGGNDVALMRLERIRIQTIDAEDALADVRWEEGVAVLDWFDGDEAARLGARILAVAADYPDAADYRAWPGPNSNSFVEWLALQTGMPVVLPCNAVGKDYTPWLRAGTSSSRTGLELETIVLGAQVGLREGVELHLLGLTVGVGLWPPQLKLPFLPAIPGGWFLPGSDPGGT